jgi:peroxiredoxin
MVLLAIIVMVFGISHCSTQEESVKAPFSRAPHFTLQDIEGKKVRLKDFRGKVVLLNFFATWCAPCRQEMPSFVKLYKKYNPQGFEILGVGLDMEGAAALTPFAKRYGVPFPLLIGTREVVVDYGDIKGVPTSFFIDQNGYIAESFIGVRPAPMMEKTIVQLLNQKA